MAYFPRRRVGAERGDGGKGKKEKEERGDMAA
jgi:hypothetical protein